MHDCSYLGCFLRLVTLFLELFNNLYQISCCEEEDRTHSMSLNLLISFQLHLQPLSAKSKKALDKVENPSVISKPIVNLLSLDNYLQRPSTMEILEHPCIRLNIPPRFSSKSRNNVRTSFLHLLLTFDMFSIYFVDQPWSYSINFFVIFVAEVRFYKFCHPYFL